MYADTFNTLIEELKKMPGIGPKSAQRLAFYILGISKVEADKLSDAILQAKAKIKYCSRCFNITDADPCKICSDPSRDQDLLGVVAEPKDLLAMERSREFRGQYHVLGGLISPLDGITPDSLRIKELLQRLQKRRFKEVVLAVSPTTEGEATCLYLTQLLRPLGIRLTRLAYGLPIGADMDYADEATLSKAYEGRREV
ncbi:MAG: recombination mediator RecR [Candidatus Margulisbacteria bacterium]|nr:recombination mediator RecR [Candidatus Margulisiibacteriota bacterium]